MEFWSDAEIQFREVLPQVEPQVGWVSAEYHNQSETSPEEDFGAVFAVLSFTL